MVADCGVDKSLVQTALKLTAPGVPDIYNGSDLWDLSMVDPDNRRPVDYARRLRLLDEIDVQLTRDRPAAMRRLRKHWFDGGIKLAIIATLLRHRREHTALYEQGDYLPLPGAGTRADDLCAYARSHTGARLMVAVTRRARRETNAPHWRDTYLPLPEPLRGMRWHELLTGRRLPTAGDAFDADALFADLPVAVLSATADPDTAGGG
jgi:(1->4)-alpha-D-glucan 1-alpha-D-glucosylmutase